MKQNINGLKDLTNEVKVEVIRRRFLHEADAKPQLFHEIDVKRVRTEDWQIERYLTSNGSADEALNSLITALEWKKSFGLHERNHKYFPKEMFKIYSYEKPSVDKNGRLALWGRQRKYKNHPEFDQLFRQFMAYLIESVDRQAGNRGWTIVYMAKTGGITEILGNQYIDYYANGCQLFLNVDTPWIIRQNWKLVKNFQSTSFVHQIKHITRDELREQFNIDSIPKWLGGTRQTIYEDITEQMPTFHEIKHLDFNLE
ncbi:uncharacterized protein LOC128961558 [Oppia nitens]|uniref:uncharacterized protein LOC128961558 n=1 Tax=Oppia nitens TaxID=1686743 RepID=UPI0023DC5F59|nr:uncharacterized protein LOC128961558 [Oppia nitens]